MIPQSGGESTYISAALGGFLGFVRLWIDCILGRAMSVAIVAKSLSQYTLKSAYESNNEPLNCNKDECDCENYNPFKWGYICLAANAVLFAGFLNCISVKLTNYIIDFVTFITILGLALIIITGVVFLVQNGINDEPITNFSWENSTTELGRIGQACYWGLFAYLGWNSLSCITGEMVNPT